MTIWRAAAAPGPGRLASVWGGSDSHVGQVLALRLRVSATGRRRLALRLRGSCHRGAAVVLYRYECTLRLRRHAARTQAAVRSAASSVAAQDLAARRRCFAALLRGPI